jgi:hypothetical protein
MVVFVFLFKGRFPFRANLLRMPIAEPQPSVGGVRAQHTDKNRHVREREGSQVLTMFVSFLNFCGNDRGSEKRSGKEKEKGVEYKKRSFCF